MNGLRGGAPEVGHPPGAVAAPTEQCTLPLRIHEPEIHRRCKGFGPSPLYDKEALPDVGVRQKLSQAAASYAETEGAYGAQAQTYAMDKDGGEVEECGAPFKFTQNAGSCLHVLSSAAGVAWRDDEELNPQEGAGGNGRTWPS